MDDPDIYEVESIIDSEAPQGRQAFKYLVKWKGWPHKYNTKEPVENLTLSKGNLDIPRALPRKIMPSRLYSQASQLARACLVEAGDNVIIISQNLTKPSRTSWNLLKTGGIFWNIIKPGRTW